MLYCNGGILVGNKCDAVVVKVHFFYNHRRDFFEGRDAIGDCFDVISPDLATK